MIPRFRKKKNASKKVATDVPSREHLKPKDLEGFFDKVKHAFGWTGGLRTHQTEGITGQLLGKSVLVHAGTGSGKTAIAAGPHVHEKSKGKVTIMVSPLIALQEEQVKTFQDEFKLTAVAVNSSHGGCTPEIMTKICAGTWQIVVISPEMLLSKRFIKNVIRNSEFACRILSVIVDEAHVISHWGSGFRKKYGSLGILRALLPKGTPIVAMSATLPPRVRRDVLNKLQFGKDDFMDINLGNDRTNVSIVVRAMQNNMNTYSDLDFLIPGDITKASQIPKAFVYADDTTVGVDIEDRLYTRIPQYLRDQGIVRPYSAAFSAEYRAEVMDLFKKGAVRILVCTDAAGMGCNIPDVDIVVQWKLPSSVLSFIQRAGRAARASGRTGLAVLLVEKTIYEADLLKVCQEDTTPKGQKARPGRVRQSNTYPKATKEYAIQHGLMRGGYGGSTENNTATGLDVPIDLNAPDEGLHSLVQTGKCRRAMLTKIFGNQQASLSVPCCDNCDPTLLIRTRPGPPIATLRATAVKSGEPNKMVRKALHTWRTSIVCNDFPDAMFGPSGILKDETMDLLSSVGPIDSKEHLARVLGGRWLWFSTYGDSLWLEISKLTIPPMQPKVKDSQGTKRAANVSQAEAESSTRQKQKRQRKEAPPSAQSSNIAIPAPPSSHQVTTPHGRVNLTPVSMPFSYQPVPAPPSTPMAPGANPYMSYVGTPLNWQCHTPSPYYRYPNPVSFASPTPRHHSTSNPGGSSAPGPSNSSSSTPSQRDIHSNT